MTRSPPFLYPIYLPLAGLVLGAALVLALSTLATPRGFQARAAKIDSVLDRADLLNARRGDPGRWPANAVCRQSAPAGATAYGLQLTQLMDLSKVAVLDIRITPSGASTADLTEVSVHLKGRGDQASVTTLLAGLAHETPVLFVDALDLRPGHEGVSLDMTGRIWCWRKS